MLIITSTQQSIDLKSKKKIETFRGDWLIELAPLLRLNLLLPYNNDDKGYSPIAISKFSFGG